MKNPNANIAHQRIRFAVSQSGLRQSEIVEEGRKYSWTTDEGKLVYVSKSDLSQYMKGKSVPGSWKACILGKVLNVSPIWLMGFETETDEKVNAEDVAKNAKVSQRIKDLMRDRNMTAKELLENCNRYGLQYGIAISKSNLSQYINGYSVPNQWKLMLLANALDVDPGWILGFEKKDDLDTSDDFNSAEENENSVFQERLLEAMIEKKCNQATLARSIGLSKSTITYYCQGKMNPRGIHLLKLAKGLDVSPEWLVGLSDEMNAEIPSLSLSQKALIEKCKNLSEEKLDLINSIVEIISKKQM